MTFFNIWINNNLLKQSNTKNNLFDEFTENYNKWIPDNKLVLQYNKYLNNSAELNRLKYILEYTLIPSFL